MVLIQFDNKGANHGTEMKESREQTTLRLPTELKVLIQKAADRRGDSFNETVLRFIRLGMKAE